MLFLIDKMYPKNVIEKKYFWCGPYLSLWILSLGQTYLFETVQNFKSRETTHDLHIMTYLKPNQILTQFRPNLVLSPSKIRW